MFCKTQEEKGKGLNGLKENVQAEPDMAVVNNIVKEISSLLKPLPPQTQQQIPEKIQQVVQQNTAKNDYQQGTMLLQMKVNRVSFRK
ncbi:MAG: hypothetical protein MJ252_07310 [archaeon]|nr:hypothetical protein [archaeon]